MLDPKLKTYPNNTKAPLFIILTLALLGVAGIGVAGKAAYDAVCAGKLVLLYIAIAGWAIIPPVWFWFEYFVVFRRFGNAGSFDLFKYGQQVAGAIWAAILAALLVFAASDLVKPTQDALSLEERAHICGSPGEG